MVTPQEKYLSEPYSEEAYDPNDTLKLLAFGEDYGQFLNQRPSSGSSFAGGFEKRRGGVSCHGYCFIYFWLPWKHFTKSPWKPIYRPKCPPLHPPQTLTKSRKNLKRS